MSSWFDIGSTLVQNNGTYFQKKFLHMFLTDCCLGAGSGFEFVFSSNNYTAKSF